MADLKFNRRSLLQGSAALGAGLAAPMIFTGSAQAYTNEPKGGTVTFGFNVPQSGAYADEGQDELRAYQLAVEHIKRRRRWRYVDDLLVQSPEGRRRERQKSRLRDW